LLFGGSHPLLVPLPSSHFVLVSCLSTAHCFRPCSVAVVQLAKIIKLFFSFLQKEFIHATLQPVLPRTSTTVNFKTSTLGPPFYFNSNNYTPPFSFYLTPIAYGHATYTSTLMGHIKNFLLTLTNSSTFYASFSRVRVV